MQWSQKAYLFLHLAFIFMIWPLSVGAKDHVENSGEILRIFLPASVLCKTWVLDDQQGSIGFVKSFLASSGVAYTLKQLVDKKRPNHESGSFPSGHTTMAFSSAAFIHQRYGLKPGLPLYLLATYVGWTRIQSENHDLWDVGAGAIIGMAGAFYFTNPYQKEILLVPIISDQRYGFVFRMPLGLQERMD